MGNLPGPMLDLLTVGVDLTRDGGRQAVVMAVRRVMLSAHRHGIPYADVHALLTDERTRVLAKQIAHGQGGRPIAPTKRNQFLRDLWDDTARVAATRPAWDKDDALGAIAHAREAFDADTTLTGNYRAVMAAVLDLADEYGTTRVAAPVHRVADMAGISESAAHRALMGLVRGGEWLSLAKRGSAVTKRANLYNLAPAALSELRMGASPPISQPPPISHPTYIPPQEGDDMFTISLQGAGLSAERQAQVLQILADEYRERVAEHGRKADDETAEKIAHARLRVMQGGAA